MARSRKRLWTAAFAVGCAIACQKSGTQKLPGQSDVPPPDEPTTGGRARACQAVAADGSTLLASRDGGWGIVVPGEGWQLDCRDATHGAAKLASDRGETLLVTVNLVAGAPSDPNLHLDSIYRRAQGVLPKAGATPGDPKFVVARATAKSPEKPVLVYQVRAPELERGGFQSYHGWSILRTSRGEVYECHLSATIRKQIDWANMLSQYLASCLPVVAR